MQRHRNGNGAPCKTLLHNAMTSLLPYAKNPCCSKIRQTSSPERTRSLPNRNLDLGDEYIAVHAAGDLALVGDFKE